MAAPIFTTKAAASSVLLAPEVSAFLNENRNRKFSLVYGNPEEIPSLTDCEKLFQAYGTVTENAHSLMHVPFVHIDNLIISKTSTASSEFEQHFIIVLQFHHSSPAASPKRSHEVYLN